MRTLQDNETFELIFIGRIWYNDLAKQIMKSAFFDKKRMAWIFPQTNLLSVYYSALPA